VLYLLGVRDRERHGAEQLIDLENVTPRRQDAKAPRKADSGAS